MPNSAKGSSAKGKENIHWIKQIGHCGTEKNNLNVVVADEPQMKGGRKELEVKTWSQVGTPLSEQMDVGETWFKAQYVLMLFQNMIIWQSKEITKRKRDEKAGG